MYTTEDFTRAKQGYHLRLGITLALLGVTLVCLVVALTVRLRTFGILAMIVGLWITYFYSATQMNPWRKYYLLLKDMENGLERQNQARFLEAADEPRMLDGVAVYDFLVYEEDDEEEQRLYLWDGDKPVPAYEKGCLLDIVSFGKYIKSVKVV